MNSPQPIEELLQAGGAALAAGRASDAQALYRNILEISPRHPVALHALGWIEYQAGNAPGAVALLKQALDANPSDPGCWNNLGIVYASLRQHEQATGAYRRAVALQPEFPAAFLNLGNALRNRGEWGELPVPLFRGFVRRLLYSAVEDKGHGLLPRIPIERRPLSEVSRTLDELKAGKIVGRVVAEIA